MTENNELKDCEGAPSGDGLKPPSPPGGSGTDKPPKRQFIKFPLSIPAGETLTSGQNEPTDPKLARDTRDRHEPQPPRQIGKNREPLDPRSIELERLLGCGYRASIFLNAEGVAFARMPGDTHNQSDVAPLHSPEFAIFLREEYYGQYRRFPTEARLRVVCELLDRDACRRGRTVALRVAQGKAEHAGEASQRQVCRQVLALDLGRPSPADPDSVLEIDSDGWSVHHRSGFAFTRPRGQRPLPLPEPASPQDLTELKDLLRLDEHDWLLLLFWLLSTMRATGPYPILVLQGEPGSGKSLTAQMLKSLIDPAAVTFQPFPTNPNTILRQANETWIQAYDHVTAMPKQISTALCRLSTGAACRLPFHRSVISLARPILLTVPTGASGAPWKPRGDLLDRILTVTLPPLTAETTRPQSEIAEKFEKIRAKILGALAHAVSVALGRVDRIRLPSYSRHADATVWAIAASPALNTTEASMREALDRKGHFSIPKEPLPQKLTTLMENRDDWQGTATKLKLELDLAEAPNHLSRKLKEMQAILRDQGIEIAFPPRQESGQLICISKVGRLREASTSQSAVDLPVGNVDSASMLAKIDRQFVSAEQPEEEPIKVAVEQHQTGSVVLPEQIRILPLDGRNSLDLDRLEPGVTAPVRAFHERGTGATVELPWTPASGTDDNGESAGAADVTIPP